MADNYLKTPLGKSLNDWATQKIKNAINSQGRALPCEVVSIIGSIVTVKFEVNAAPFTLPQVTMAIAGSEYVRLPIQVGCKGVTFPASTRLGIVNGLGGGVPVLTDTPGNLATLTFFPIGNKNWDPSENPNALLLYGPDGVIIRTQGGSVKAVLSSTGVVVTGDLSNTGALSAGNGASGTFTSQDGKTITVLHGIVTDIV